MSTATLRSAPHKRSADVDDAINYRAIHLGAIVGLVLGVLSVFTLVSAGVLSRKRE